MREALRRLEQDGIIQAVPGRGLVVTELTIKDVEDMLELLRLMDAHAAYLAAQRRTPLQAEQLASVTRALMAPAELPVGILTALLGGPFFLWLLVFRRRE